MLAEANTSDGEACSRPSALLARHRHVMPSPLWTETFRGGTLKAEQALFRVMAEEILQARQSAIGQDGTSQTLRALYAKTLVGVRNASLVMDRTFPEELAIGHFRPGASLPALIRLSNASSVPQADNAPDMRGLTIRLTLPDASIHDLVLANFPTSLARDAEQFLQFSVTAAGDRETLLARLAARMGVPESRRIAAYFKTSFKLGLSLANEHFWSGCAFLWGERPVRFEFRPTISSLSPAPVPPRSGDALRLEFAARLMAGDIRYRLAIQQYRDEKRTPIEDAAIDWRQRIAPSLEIATLIIPQQDILSPEGVAVLRDLDRLAFTPWNAPAQFRPLGSLNRLRRIVYEMSAAARLAADRQG